MRRSCNDTLYGDARQTAAADGDITAENVPAENVPGKNASGENAAAKYVLFTGYGAAGRVIRTECMQPVRNDDAVSRYGRDAGRHGVHPMAAVESDVSD